MRRRVVAVLAVAAAVLAVGWSLLLGSRTPVASRPAAVQPPEASDAPPPLLAAPPTAEGARVRGGAATTGSAMDPQAGEGEEESTPAVSLLLITVDADTGLPVASTWNVGDGSVVMWPPGAMAGEPGLDALERGLRADWEAHFLASGEERPDALAANTGGLGVLAVTVRPPPEYLPPPRGLEITGPLAAGVRRALAVVPLHREAPLHVRVLGPDGRAAQGAEVSAVEVAGKTFVPKVDDLGPGEFRVRGIPHLVGDTVALAISWETADGPRSEAVLPPTPQEGLGGGIASTSIPADLATPWSLVVRLPGGTGSVLVDHVESDNDLPVEAELLGKAEAGTPVGSARVVTLGWDGTPLRGVMVYGGRTDRDGVLRIADLPPGDCRFHVSPAGRLPARATAAVRAGAEVEVVLREPVGAVLDVRVTDGDGNPRPGALLRVVGARVFDVSDRTQRLDRFTDAQGRRTFARVEPGTWTVAAEWGSRRASDTVVLRDGERTGVHLVVK